MTLHVHAWGDPGGELIVCLHGIGWGGAVFQRLAVERMSNYRVLAPDLRGHGRSDREPPWSVNQHLDDLFQRFAPERFTLLGFSFGARLALEFAARWQSQVERLVLLEPALRIRSHVCFDMAENEFRTATYASLEDAVQERYDTNRVTYAPRDWVRTDMEAFLEHTPDGRLRRDFTRGAAVTAWSEMAAAPPPYEAVDITTLVVMGADSGVVAPHDLDNYRGALGDKLEVVVVPGGHSILWDSLALTSDAILSFLAVGSARLTTISG